MTRWQKSEHAGLRFLTGNVYRRMPLFKRPEYCRLLLDSLDFCRRKYGLHVYGFVIMPDHFHLLMGVPGKDVLANFLRDWKGFTAHSVVEHLRTPERRALLRKFEASNTRRRKDSRFHIFQPDTHVEFVLSRRFAMQKLNYIHKNPVVAGLVDNPVDYPFSSARNWSLNDHSVFRVDVLDL